MVERRGLSNRFVIDSCGTGGGSPDWYTERGWSYHEGDAADSRVRPFDIQEHLPSLASHFAPVLLGR